MSTHASHCSIGMRVGVGLCAIALSACAATSSPRSGIRYHNAPVVWRVADDKPVPKPTAPRELLTFYHFDQLLYRPVDRALGVPRYHRADNVNSLGEVPDSSWFVNRVGRRSLTSQAVRDGPLAGKDDPRPPYLVLKVKAVGSRHSLMVRDSRGDRYFFKFDRATLPVAESAAHIVVNRLLWAVGYNVAEDSIIDVEATDFRVGPDAKRTSQQFSGQDKPLSQLYLDKILTKKYRARNGRIRVLVSRFLPGKPLGGFSQTGVRDDDPNDRVAHERRRELRGMFVFYSWLKSTDMKTDNTLDMWEKGEGDLGFVRHYLLDFGMSLGVNGLALGTRGDGYERFFSWSQALGRAFTFGWPWHWEKIVTPGQAHVGPLEVQGYRPNAHRTRVPYFPWDSRDRFDTFWAAKLLARLDEAHLRAAVEAAKYPDFRSGEYVVKQLIGRRRIALQYWFSSLAPIDAVALEGGGRFCLTDLGLEHGVLAAPTYVVTAYDYEGRILRSGLTMARAGSRYCVAKVRRGERENGYTIIMVRGRRGDDTLPPVEVHLARDARTGIERVIGIRRH